VTLLTRRIIELAPTERPAGVFDIIMINLYRSNCYIHLIGAMNPSLHQPSWYRLQELITVDEEKYAYEIGKAMLLPPPQPYSCFDVGTFKTECAFGGWTISTRSSDHFSRIRSVAERLFDDILPHTPVAEFWLEFGYSYRTADDKISASLELLASAIPLDFRLRSPSLDSLVMKETRDRITIYVMLDFAKDKLSFNVNTKIKSEGQGEGPRVRYWTLKEHFEQWFEEYRREAEERAASIAADFQSQRFNYDLPRT
jgi:hypothetical protein